MFFFLKNRPGSFIIRQSCEKYGYFYLHYLPNTPFLSPEREELPENAPSSSSPPSPPHRQQQQSRRRMEVLHIVRRRASEAAGAPLRYFLGGGPGGVRQTDFGSLQELIKFLRSPAGGVGGAPLIRDCVHPSENDKARTLLLCRSIAKLKAGRLDCSNACMI